VRAPPASKAPLCGDSWRPLSGCTRGAHWATGARGRNSSYTFGITRGLPRAAPRGSRGRFLIGCAGNPRLGGGRAAHSPFHSQKRQRPHFCDSSSLLTSEWELKTGSVFEVIPPLKGRGERGEREVCVEGSAHAHKSHPPVHSLTASDCTCPMGARAQFPSSPPHGASCSLPFPRSVERTLPVHSLLRVRTFSGTVYVLSARLW